MFARLGCRAVFDGSFSGELSIISVPFGGFSFFFGDVSCFRSFGDRSFTGERHGLGLGHLRLGTFKHGHSGFSFGGRGGHNERSFGLSFCEFSLSCGDSIGHSRFEQGLEVVCEPTLMEWGSHIEVCCCVEKTVFQEFRDCHTRSGEDHSSGAVRTAALDAVTQAASGGGVSIGDEQPRGWAICIDVVSAKKVGEFNVGVGQM